MRLHIQVNETTEKQGATVKELMSTELLTLFKDDTLKSLQDLFDLKMIRHVPIVDDDRMLVGLVSQRDFLKFSVSKLARIGKDDADELYSKTRISEIMGKKVMTVSPGTPLSVAGAAMLKHKYGCLPVIDKDRLVGIITESDFVEAFVSYDD
ncbi:MAG: CBS domain-containing protein [Deltaproteobacteria bacterium]|nr:CBS domain-containing protein [Deltaproteobacteria bacterium]